MSRPPSPSLLALPCLAGSWAVFMKTGDIPPRGNFMTCRPGGDHVPPAGPPDGVSWGLQVLPAARQLQGLGCSSAGCAEGGSIEPISSVLISGEQAGGLSGCFAAS